MILHSGSVLGADGFGYAADGHHHIKMPQVGGVVIADDVEIGANSCVDRATFGATRIGRRTKIDNMVQIGHNCQIGDDCVLSGQVGLAGSTIIEDRVLVGGNVGTAGHLRIGAGARIGAKSGVHRDVPPGAVVMGYPELEISVYRRVMAALPPTAATAASGTTARRGPRGRPGEAAVTVEIGDIMKALPHRYPFLLVDRIVAVERGERVVGIKNVTINEPFFQGHFPGNPVMPGVLVLEAMAQVGAVMFLEQMNDFNDKYLYLAGIDDVRFRRPVIPGIS